MEMWIVLIFVIGVVFGSILTKTLTHKKSIGVLRIDDSDPESEPYLFLELTGATVNDIYNKKYVSFKVNTKGYLSQK